MICFHEFFTHSIIDSILRGLSNDMIQDQSYAKEMSDQVVLFVTELFREKVELQHASIVEKSRVSECNDGEASSSHKDSSSLYPQTVDDDDELFMTALNMAGQEVVEQDGNTTLESHMDMFKKEVALEVKEFESFCQAIDWKSMVTNFPTAKTCDLTKNKEVGFDEAKLKMNPRYIRSLFDVIKWWNSEGVVLFPHLGVAAVIVMAKAAHNGFQERVFSIGTFLDTKQQQKRDKMHYEMDLLQRVNRELMLESKIYLLFNDNDTDEPKNKVDQSKNKVDQFFLPTDLLESSVLSRGGLNDDKSISDTECDKSEELITPEEVQQNMEDRMSNRLKWHDMLDSSDSEGDQDNLN